MPEVLTLGPVLLPTLRTGLLLCLLLAIYLSGWFARRRGQDRAGAIVLAEGAIIAGLIGARLGFGLLHYQAYATEPWTILYIWQPGFDWLSGGLGALAWLAWRRRRGLLSLGDLGTLARGFALPALMLALLLGALQWSRLHGSDAVAGILPSAVMERIDGQRIDTRTLEGRPLIINFWASWCPPCLRELPLLNRVQQQYQATGLQVLGINVAEDAATVRSFLEQTPLAYPVLLDPGHDTAQTQSLHARMRVRGLPTTYFVSADGMIRSRYIGELSQALTDIRVAELLE